MPSLFDTAKQLAQHVEDRALEMHVPISISVVDIHGNLVLKHRMNGAPLISLESVTSAPAVPSASTGNARI